MSAASTETSAGSRVFFQGAPGVGCVGSGPINGEDPVQKKQGKVTVKYDRKELRKRLVLEEWIIEQLSDLYDCEEDEMPEVEIDIDDLLEVNNDDERASKLQANLHQSKRTPERQGTQFIRARKTWSSLRAV
uniref:Protein phosphatase 1, regulatory (inhibitor) subunit 14C n=1 Tax=Oryzias latipes TaxID=8090 RepID=A0A3P9K2G5_ORYLA